MESTNANSDPPVTLITGAATGIGNLTARTLAAAGHTVYATMRDPHERDERAAADLLAFASERNYAIGVVELDVRSEGSARRAVEHVVEVEGRIDTVVNNAGHLYVGYVEAFTASDVNNLIDVNATGAHRVNRAALPYLRAQRAGTLLYVGSTIPVTTPPFLGPYVASKAAMDALAVVTAYEVGQFGIDTVIVQPGAFPSGTSHFAMASHASDEAVTEAYAELDPLVALNHEAHERLLTPGESHDPQLVADEIARILTLPAGERPFRSVVDITHAGVEEANEVLTRLRHDFVKRMGFERVLEVQR